MKRNIEVKIVDESFNVDHLGNPKNKPVNIEVEITDIKPTTTNVTFKCDIPDYLYNVLVDSSDKYTLPAFSKRVSFYTLKGLIEYLQKISSDAVQQNFFINGDNRKVIIVKYDNDFRTISNSWSSGNEGLAVSNWFQFAVCYQTKGGTIYTFHTANGEYRAGGVTLKEGFGGKMNSFKVLEWSQDKEDFLNSIQQQMHSLNQRLADYLKDLTDEKITMLMSSNTKLLN